MNDTTKTQIHQSLKDATVKIFADGKFQGSGFFVTPNGYLVTAYHCVAKPAMRDVSGKPMPQELYQTLKVETSPKVPWPAEVDKDKSLPDLDIAVLKVSHSPKQYLPIGRLSEQWEGDEVVGCGCPGGDKPGMDKIATYPGIFTRILTDDRELIEVQNAIIGHGQSGGAIYHYGSQRVIAIADMGFKDKTVSTAPLAVRLDKLFEKWQTLGGQTELVAKQWNARLQPKETQPIPSSPRYRRLTLLSMVFVVAMSGVVFWVFNPPKSPVSEDEDIELPSPTPVPQETSSTTIPSPMKKLGMSNIDEIKEGVHVINFTLPDRKTRLVRLNNPNSTPVQVSLIGFPEQFFYTSLMDDSSLIEAHTQKDFRLVLMLDIPDKNEYEFQIDDENQNHLRIRIRLQGNWHNYIGQKLSQINQTISAIPSATPMKIYEVAKQVTEEEYQELPAGVKSVGLKEALTGQVLMSNRVNQPKAAAIAYARAEPTVPKVVERMVTTTPVMVALAQTHYDNWDYKKAASWYNNAAKQGDAEAQYALGKLYEKGNGVEKDAGKALDLFKKSANQGHSEAKTVLESLATENNTPGERELAVQGYSDAKTVLESLATENNTYGGRELAVLKGHQDSVRSAAFSPDGLRVVTASWDKTARLWEVATGREVAVLKGHESSVTAAAFSPDGLRVVTASWDKTARLWEVATGREVAVLKGHQDWVTAAAFSPDGQRVVTASGDKTARLWEVATGRQLAVLKGHEKSVNSAVFSRDGLRVVTASLDKTARLWEVTTGRELAVLIGHQDGVGSAAFSPDGQRVVTASLDKTARLWEVTTGRELAVLIGHQDGVGSAAFSPDGQRVVTASLDKTARLWEVATGRELAVLTGHQNWVNSAAFSPDGRRVVTASDDKTARLWEVFANR